MSADSDLLISMGADPCDYPEKDQPDVIEEIGASVDQINKVAKEDLDFLAALIMPLVFQFPFPPVFKSIWSWLVSYADKPRIFPQLALGLPRGF